MLIPNAFDKLGLKGVIHVGAHLCEEKATYDRLGLKTLWIEANPQIAELNPNVICAAISDVVGEAQFSITNNGQSSSLLKLKEHKDVYPHVVETQNITVRTTTLDILIRNPEDYDSINLDIQGAELKALIGATKILPNIKAIYTEVNIRELYEGCALIWQIDSFLAQFGFLRVETAWEGNSGWGDALYVKWNNSFYPDGSSDSVEITLASRSENDPRHFIVQVIGLTGLVRSRLLDAVALESKQE